MQLDVVGERGIEKLGSGFERAIVSESGIGHTAGTADDDVVGEARVLQNLGIAENGALATGDGPASDASPGLNVSAAPKRRARMTPAIDATADGGLHFGRQMGNERHRRADFNVAATGDVAEVGRCDC